MIASPHFLKYRFGRLIWARLMVITASFVVTNFCATASASDNALSSPSRTIDDYIEFYDPRKSAVMPIMPEGSAVLPWYSSEIALVRSLVGQIDQVCPGLVKICGFGQKLLFVKGKNTEHLASSNSRRVLLSDYAFKVTPPGLQEDVLVHEMVHVADPGSEIAYSRKWVSYALPLIQRVRANAKFVKESEKKEYLKQLKAKVSWLGLYAATNVHEALASYVCTEVFSKNMDLQLFAPNILNPSPQYLERSLLWTQMRDASNLGQIDESLRLCEKLRGLSTPSPLLEFYFAKCYLIKGDLRNAEKFGRISILKFKRLGLDASDLLVRRALMQQADILWQLKRQRAAIECLDRIVAVCPNDKSVLATRADRLLKSGRRLDGLHELYFSLGYFELSECSDLSTLTPQLFKRLIETLRTRPEYSDFDHQLCCARLLEGASRQRHLRKVVASLALTPMQCLESALQYAKSSRSKSLCRLYQARFSLNSGESEDALKIIDELLLDNPSNINALLLKLDALKKDKSTKLEAANLEDTVQELLKKTPSNKEKSVDSFSVLDASEVIELSDSSKCCLSVFWLIEYSRFNNYRAAVD